MWIEFPASKKIEKMKMMEVENLEEYQSLIRDRSKVPFHHWMKHTWLKTSAEKKVVAAVLMCLTIGVSFVALKKTSVASHSKGDLLSTNEDILWQPNSEEERQVFLRLWNNSNETLLNSLTSMQSSRGLIGKTNKYANADKIYAHCELLLETVKRSLKKCVSLTVLPKNCYDLITMQFPCQQGYLQYRQWDGACNNLVHTDWGMTGNNFNRWMKAAYMDDVSEIRQSVFGGELPEPRYLSNLLFSHKTLPDSDASMLLTNFGLYIGNDVALLGFGGGSFPTCCNKDPTKRDFNCMQLYYPEDDPLYGPLNKTCSGFFRSPPFPGDCPGRREQQNRMTAYLDLSNTYGASHELGQNLRVHQKGLMTHSTIHNTPLLPQTKDGKGFVSGDTRVNMVLHLMAIHTIWLREHNRVAAELSQINPTWDDDRLFQEARRIVIAEYQHILYKEFLPVIFGPRDIKDLLIDEDKPYNGYDENLNAGINNAFVTDALRFGHTLIKKTVQMRDENFDVKSEMSLLATYYNPSVLINRGFDDVVRGMVGQKAHDPADHYAPDEIRGRMFQSPPVPFGDDLTSISILRSRDHGIPPYLAWRTFCNLTVPNSWEDLKNYMESDYAEALQKAYRSIEDIDLYTGATGEKRVEGSMLGDTYICLLGAQFVALRKGDRFWYENLNHPGAFTKDQLKEIYKVTSGRLLCDTSDNIKKLPKNAFYTPSDKNPVMNCEEFPKMDLKRWM